MPGDAVNPGGLIRTNMEILNAIGAFFTGISWKTYLYAGVVVLFMGTGVFGYMKYKHMNDTILQDQQTISMQSLRISRAEAVIKQQQVDAKAVTQAHNVTADEAKKSDEAVKDFQKKFHGKGKDAFKVKLNFDPVAMEAAINKNTADAIRCISIVTGQPLTEEEKNETDKSKGNSVCPDVANPRIH